MSATRVMTPFDATTTAAAVLDGVRLDARTAVVTGASSGLGVETARALARAGARVVLAVRNVEAGAVVANAIRGEVPGADLDVRHLDLADQDSVRDFVHAWAEPLHILVNNAGVMATPEMRTREGWELQFATNHLGHFALATGLHSSLAEAGGARVVVLSSVGHVNADVDLDDIHFERRPYDPFIAYAQSKTANALFAVEAARRWAKDSIAVNALNPGRILTTGLIRHIGDVTAGPSQFGPKSSDVSYKDAEQGAATSCLLAGSPLVEGVTGKYFEDCQEAVPHVPPKLRGVASWAIDPVRAAALWELSGHFISTAEPRP